jgi:hypothetical protein
MLGEYDCRQQEAKQYINSHANAERQERLAAGRKASRVGKFRRADLGPRDTCRQMQHPRRERENKDHHDCPQDHARDGDWCVVLSGAYSAGDGNCGRYAAHRTPSADRGR